MELKYIFAGFCVLFASSAFSQALGQDSEGSSTIIVPTATLNLDVTSTVGTFTFNRKFPDKIKAMPEKEFEIHCSELVIPEKIDTCIQNQTDDFLKSYHNSGFIAGLDIKGSIKEGLGNLFTKEKLTSSTALGMLVGRYWSHLTYDAEGLKGILALEKKKMLDDSKLQQAIDRVTPQMLATVSGLSGMALVRLNPIHPPKTTAEKIDFYKNSLKETSYGTIVKQQFEDDEKVLLQKKEQLVLLRKLVTDAIDLYTSSADFIELAVSIKKMEDAKKNINSSGTDAEKKIAVIDKDIKVAQELQEKLVPKDNNKLALYQKYVSYTNLYPLAVATGMIAKPFVKKNWDDNLKVIDENIEETDLQVKMVASKIGTDYSADPEYVKFHDAFTALLEYYQKKQIDEDAGSGKLKTDYVYRSSKMVFLRGFLNGSDFKYDLANGATTIGKRFEDKTFNGYTIELGYNYSFKSYHYLGFSGAINYTNNLADLESTTYKLDTTDPSITDGKFSTSKEIKALSGTFDTFVRYDFNADYVWLISLKEDPTSASDKDSQLYLSFNPYLRHRIYEKSVLNLKNNTIVGLGLHVYNSNDNKIMGGVFVQSEDFFGVQVPENEESTLGKRIIFGLIAKFAFTGLKIEKK